MKKSSLKNYIAFLEAAAIANASSYWMRQHKLMGEELLKAKDEIAELKRMLDDNGGLCTLRAKLTAETCEEALTRLREDNARLRKHYADAANARDYWIREFELMGEALLEAENHIAELKRRSK